MLYGKDGMESRAAMSTYCKAQAQINKIEKENDEQRKALNERIKTCRSLLHDDMIARNLSCIEMIPEGSETPVYLRVKSQTTMEPVDANTVMDILRRIEHTTLTEIAEKNGHDLPKMLTTLLGAHIKEKHTIKTDKSSLSITSAKERGFTRELQESAPDQMLQMASDLLLARSELSTLKQKQNSDKQTCIEEQKEVEDIVKTSLKKTDPVNMMTRVHMMQDGNEWVYYLRCKEKEVRQSVGIRKIIPMVEASVVHVLSTMGMGREFDASFKLNGQFWKEFYTDLEQRMQVAKSETKRQSRLCLDRGAPRRSIKNY